MKDYPRHQRETHPSCLPGAHVICPGAKSPRPAIIGRFMLDHRRENGSERGGWLAESAGWGEGTQGQFYRGVLNWRLDNDCARVVGRGGECSHLPAPMRAWLVVQPQQSCGLAWGQTDIKTVQRIRQSIAHSLNECLLARPTIVGG